MALNGLHSQEEQRLHEAIAIYQLELIDSKLDLILMKVDTLSVTTKSTRPSVDWGKILEFLDRLWVKLMVLLLMWTGTLKMGDLLTVLLKK